jgi:hypothetical protein
MMHPDSTNDIYRNFSDDRGIDRDIADTIARVFRYRVFSSRSLCLNYAFLSVGEFKKEVPPTPAIGRKKGGLSIEAEEGRNSLFCFSMFYIPFTG